MAQLTKLCEGQFDCLQRYFTQLTTDDLKELSPSDLEDAATPADKLLMKLFIKRHLEKFFAHCDPFEKNGNDLNTNTPERQVLNTEGRLISSALKEFKSLSKPDIVSFFNSYTPDNDILEVNLAHNNLLDVDLPLIEELLKGTCPNWEIIILRWNRFHGWSSDTRDKLDKAVRDLLTQEKTNLVDLRENPLATIDRVDLFQKLTAKELSRLLWIPKSYLDHGAWKRMINPDYHQLVLETHKRYYK